MKPTIHFYSDCPFFAGCENMLVNFFSDPQIREDFEVSFSFRYSPEYSKGFQSRVQNAPRSIPLELLDVDAQLARICLRPARIAVRLVSDLLLIKYLFLLLNTMHLVKVFRGQRIDVLHINNGGYPGAYSCTAAVFAAHKIGIRNIVYVVNNIATPYTSYWRWLDWPLDRLVRRAVTQFVTGSEHARNRLAAVLQLKKGKAVNIPNGIAVRPVTEAPDEYLARLGLRHDRLIVGVVALLEWRKGHLILLQAMNSIRQQFGADAVPILLIEGDGPMSKRLRRYVRDTDLDAYVRFIGREAKVFNLLNTVDIVVLPSLCQEDFPNVTLEAMSLGKPVIGTRLSGIPEQIDDGVTGLIVTPGDVAELAAAIYKLMSTPELRHSMADAARQRFNHAYSAPIAVRRYKDLYRLLLKTTCA